MTATDTPATFDRLIIHQFDPLVTAPGGIDTCIRGLIRYAPETLRLGFVGVAATPDGDSLLPQQAQPAKQTGRFVGDAIARLVRGRPVGRFRYRDLGSMATIGRRSAIADLPLGIHLRGTLGWIAWLFLHLFQLAGLRNRANVLVNWVWSYLTYDRGPRLIRKG